MPVGPDSAASIRRTISARKDSSAAAVARMVSGPVRFSVPACSAEPGSTACGALSPETSAQSRSERPFSRSEEHTSELQSLMRNSYAVFCLKKKNLQHKNTTRRPQLIHDYTTHNT